jgi:subtilase family serine protease
MRRLSAFLIFVFLTSNVIFAQGAKPVLTEPVDESNLVRLAGNTLPAPLAQIDRGAVADSMALNHLLLTLKRPAEAQFRLQRELDAMHDPASPRYHHWLTTTELGERFGLASQDTKVLRHWLESHGFIVNRIYQNGLLIDFSGNAGQVRAAFHTEIHNLVLPNGEKHIANISDPQIPAALAPGVEGVASLHDFFPKPHRIDRGSLTYSPDSQTWHPHFTLPYKGTTYHVVAPFDFATIYNLLPLWKRGITGKGVTIATVEDSNLAHPQDWAAFRESFGMDGFTEGNFKQIYPNCANPGQNGDEIEAALDVEWASASAPDANVELSACANSRTTSGLDLAIINLLETAPPDIISDSYGLCETINADANGVPVSKYWSATNNPKTLASALSYIPEIPWNDTCASELIYSDPKNGRYTQS